MLFFNACTHQHTHARARAHTHTHTHTTPVTAQVALRALFEGDPGSVCTVNSCVGVTSDLKDVAAVLKRVTRQRVLLSGAEFVDIREAGLRRSYGGWADLSLLFRWDSLSNHLPSTECWPLQKIACCPLAVRQLAACFAIGHYVAGKLAGHSLSASSCWPLTRHSLAARCRING